MSSRPKKPHFKAAFVALLGTLSFQGFSALQSPSDPLSESWGRPLERRISKLKESGKLDSKHMPWANHYWPSREGGIAARWQDRESRSIAQATPPIDNFRYSAPKRAELLRMPRPAQRDFVNALSPAEKFDLLRGRYDFPLLAAERKRTYPERETQAGLTEGWVVGAMTLQEPSSFAKRNADRIEIQFTASDIKALMAYYYGVRAKKKITSFQAGERCRKDKFCRTLDPASFHILLANELGNEKQARSFALDLDPTLGSDHRPVTGFKSDIRYQKEGYYKVTTTIHYARIRAPQSGPYEFYNLDTDRATYRYTLEVNSKDEIVGGSWISESHPEFAWRAEPVALEAEFELLKDLYHPAGAG